MKAIPNIKVNDRVNILSYPGHAKPRPGSGKVIAIVGVGVELTTDEVFELYGDVTKTKLKNGRTLRPEMFTRPLKTDRIIVRRDDPKPGSDGFFIVPVPNRPFGDAGFFPLTVISEVKCNPALD
jgi:hypothetical protein